MDRPHEIQHTDWHRTHEYLLRQLGDEAQLLSNMHMKAHEYYNQRNRKYQLPVIIFSVLSGSGNFISTNFDDEDQQRHMILAIGALSIITSIISSVSQFLKLSEFSEAHRTASLHWQKYYTNLRFTLLQRRKDRSMLPAYINDIYSEYQRLREISPIIPKPIRSKLKRKRKRLGKMSIPVTVGGIRRTEVWDEERERVFRESHIPSFDETDSISTAEEGGAENDAARAASHASYSSFTNAHRSPTSFRFPPPPFTQHYYPSEDEPTAVPTAMPSAMPSAAPAPAPTTPTSITSTLTVPDQQAQQNNSAAAPFRESAV